MWRWDMGWYNFLKDKDTIVLTPFKTNSTLLSVGDVKPLLVKFVTLPIEILKQNIYHEKKWR
jgi:hypothetical protein